MYKKIVIQLWSQCTLCLFQRSSIYSCFIYFRVQPWLWRDAKAEPWKALGTNSALYTEHFFRLFILSTITFSWKVTKCNTKEEMESNSLPFTHLFVPTCLVRYSRGEELMLSWAEHLERSGPNRTSSRKSSYLEPAQWLQMASPELTPAGQQRQEILWNNWSWFSYKEQKCIDSEGIINRRSEHLLHLSHIHIHHNFMTL